MAKFPKNLELSATDQAAREAALGFYILGSDATFVASAPIEMVNKILNEIEKQQRTNKHPSNIIVNQTAAIDMGDVQPPTPQQQFYKWVNSGYISQEHGNYTIDLKYKKGKLTINGYTFDE